MIKSVTNKKREFVCTRFKVRQGSNQKLRNIKIQFVTLVGTRQNFKNGNHCVAAAPHPSRTRSAGKLAVRDQAEGAGQYKHLLRYGAKCEGSRQVASDVRRPRGGRGAEGKNLRTDGPHQPARVREQHPKGERIAGNALPADDQRQRRQQQRHIIVGGSSGSRGFGAHVRGQGGPAGEPQLERFRFLDVPRIALLATSCLL